jgi:hypothetical protein
MDVGGGGVGGGGEWVFLVVLYTEGTNPVVVIEKLSDMFQLPTTCS